MTRIESNIHPLLQKTRMGFLRAVVDVRKEAERNLRSSRANAVTVNLSQAKDRATIHSNVPYGLIRQWGGTIRPKNASGYLTFRTRQGNWVRTKASRQRPTYWLSRAGKSFGHHLTGHLRRLG
jgi:hypothetical protein